MPRKAFACRNQLADGILTASRLAITRDFKTNQCSKRTAAWLFRRFGEAFVFASPRKSDIQTGIQKKSDHNKQHVAVESKLCTICTVRRFPGTRRYYGDAGIAPGR